MKNDKSILKALDELPPKLEGLYEKILLRIEVEHGPHLPEIRKMITWLVQAIEPLTPEMLAEAVAVEPQDTRLDLESVATDPEDLLELLPSLVRVNR